MKNYDEQNDPKKLFTNLKRGAKTPPDSTHMAHVALNLWSHFTVDVPLSKKNEHMPILSVCQLIHYIHYYCINMYIEKHPKFLTTRT